MEFRKEYPVTKKLLLGPSFHMRSKLFLISQWLLLIFEFILGLVAIFMGLIIPNFIFLTLGLFILCVLVLVLVYMYLGVNRVYNYFAKNNYTVVFQVTPEAIILTDTQNAQKRTIKLSEIKKVYVSGGFTFIQPELLAITAVPNSQLSQAEQAYLLSLGK